MRHMFTYDEIQQEFNDRNYILVTDHKIKSTEKYEYICKKHKDKGSQFINWGHFHYNKRGCYYCGIEKCGSARKKDLSEYNGRELAESKGFEYVGISRHDKKIWIQFICPKHRQYGVQEMPYNNMKRVVVGCQHCIGRNDSEEEVLYEMYEANPYIILLEPYKGRTKKIKMMCILHNVIFVSTPYDIISGKGCMQCGLDKLSQSLKIPIEIYIKKLNERFEYIKLVSGYNGVTQLADFYCEKCNNSFIDYPNYILRRGCPNCNSTSMEQKISKILTHYGIEYKHQFSFIDCKDKRSLPFDFYLPKYNILIEYDGRQHYYPVNFGGISDEDALKNLEITQKHDKIKTEYCKTHHIPLIRIPYWDNENIEQIILDNIKCYTKQND